MDDPLEVPLSFDHRASSSIVRMEDGE